VTKTEATKKQKKTLNKKNDKETKQNRQKHKLGKYKKYISILPRFMGEGGDKQIKCQCKKVKQEMQTHIGISKMKVPPQPQ